MKEADRFGRCVEGLIDLGWRWNGVPLDVILTIARNCDKVVEIKHDLKANEARIWFIDGSEALFAED